MITYETFRKGKGKGVGRGLGYDRYNRLRNYATNSIKCYKKSNNEICNYCVNIQKHYEINAIDETLYPVLKHCW